MSQATLTLRFDGPAIPAETVMQEHGTPRLKRPPVLVRAPTASIPSLDTGPYLSIPRRLDCLRGVDLVWANLFIKDGRCCTPNDSSDIMSYLTHLVDSPGLPQDHVGILRSGNGFVVPQDRFRDAERVPGLVMFAGGEDVHNWGMWLLQVLPAALHFIAHRSAYRRLFVYAHHPNMRAMLGLLGLVEHRDLTYHNITRAYRFEEVHLFRQAWFDYRLPPAVHEALARLGQRVAAGTDVAALGPRPFVVRHRRVEEFGGSRRLTNEDELVARAEALGYLPRRAGVPDHRPAGRPVRPGRAAGRAGRRRPVQHRLLPPRHAAGRHRGHDAVPAGAHQPLRRLRPALQPGGRPARPRRPRAGPEAVVRRPGRGGGGPCQRRGVERAAVLGVGSRGTAAPGRISAKLTEASSGCPELGAASQKGSSSSRTRSAAPCRLSRSASSRTQDAAVRGHRPHLQVGYCLPERRRKRDGRAAFPRDLVDAVPQTIHDLPIGNAIRFTNRTWTQNPS